jgi:Family of unknown function (DUF5985)
MMAGIVYALCTIAALLCSWLLLKAYRRSHYKLLLWGGLCFLGLTLNNALLIIDRILIPYQDLYTWRLAAALLSMLVLLYGLIWDAE